MDNEKDKNKKDSKDSNDVKINLKASKSEEGNKSIVILDEQFTSPKEEIANENKPDISSRLRESTVKIIKIKEKKDDKDSVIKFKHPEDNVQVNQNKSNENSRNKGTNVRKKVTDNDKTEEKKVNFKASKDLKDAPNKRNSLKKNLNDKAKYNTVNNHKQDDVTPQVIELGRVEERKENYRTNPNRPLNKDTIDEDMQDHLGELVVDVDKGLLVNQNEFEGIDKQDLNDPEVFKRLEEEVDHLHPRKETGKYN